MKIKDRREELRSEINRFALPPVDRKYSDVALYEAERECVINKYDSSFKVCGTEIYYKNKEELLSDYVDAVLDRRYFGENSAINYGDIPSEAYPPSYNSSNSRTLDDKKELLHSLDNRYGNLLYLHYLYTFLDGEKEVDRDVLLKAEGNVNTTYNGRREGRRALEEFSGAILGRLQMIKGVER